MPRSRSPKPSASAHEHDAPGAPTHANPFAMLHAKGWQRATTQASSTHAAHSRMLALWLLEQACRGTRYFDSAYALAASYRDAGEDAAASIAALVRKEVGRGFGVGFAAGLTGPLAAPIAIPTSLLATYLIQARMVAAIALLWGHDIEHRATRTAILMALGDDGTGNQAARRDEHTQTLRRLWQHASGPALSLLQRRASQALLTRTRRHGLFRVARGLPIVGAIAGGSVDAYSCLKVAERAQRLLQPQEPAQEMD